MGTVRPIGVRAGHAGRTLEARQESKNFLLLPLLNGENCAPRNAPAGVLTPYKLIMEGNDMSSILRYEPWSVHRELLNEFNRFFERERAGQQDDSSGATADWVPAVDIEEHADKFVIYADVPGVDPQGIDISLEKGLLTLSGSRERAVPHADVQGRRSERTTGRFFRRFTRPDTADSEAVSARGANGVLEIAIPKRQAAQPRRIAITH